MSEEYEGDPPRVDPGEVDALFREALELDGVARARFLEERASDAGVRRRVIDLLALEEISTGFLETPAGSVHEQVFAILAEDEAHAEEAGHGEPGQAGKRLGAYRLLQPIGRGGMASVWLAERADGAWTGQVAAKLIRKGLDTADVLQRFRAERQILSSLSHPGICRLLDGGETEDGQPFLVMELVDGRPITEFADAHRLGVDERVALFLHVAEAVASAHRSMVVHRDLKPSNILVDTEGRVRLLDFGIAKLLDPERGAAGEGSTRHESRLLTPEYASPEQLRGEAVTAASDTFQLGVLLYRLLTLHSPFPAVAPGGSALQTRLSRLGEPIEAPSELVRRTGDDERFLAATGAHAARVARKLSGDLDLIVLEALEEDADRRYPSAAALAADLEAYLGGYPIAARPPSVAYRFGKLSRRNPWLVPTAAVFLLLLGAYVVSLSRSAVRLAKERDRARLEAATAGEVTDFLVGLFGQSSPYAGGSVDTSARELLDQGARRLLAEPVDDPVVHGRIVQAVAQAYLDFDLANEAAALLDAAYASEEDWSGVPDELRLSLVALHGHSLVRSDRYDDARARLTTARQGREARGETGTPEYVYILASLSEAGFMNGDAEEATALSDVWVPLALALDDPDPNLVVRALDRQFHLGANDAASPAAEALVRERMELARARFGPDSPPFHHALDDLVSSLMARGAFTEAHPVQQEALRIATSMFGPESPTTLISVESLASIEGMLGSHAEALRLQQDVLRGRLELYGAEHVLIPITRMRLARHLRETGRPDQALEQIRLALPPTRRMFGDESTMTARMLEELGMVHWALGSTADAETHLSEAGVVFRTRYEPTDVPRVLWEIEWSSLRAALGHTDEAASRLGELAGRLADAPDDRSELRDRVVRALIGIYSGAGREEDARQWRREFTGRG